MVRFLVIMFDFIVFMYVFFRLLENFFRVLLLLSLVLCASLRVYVKMEVLIKKGYIEVSFIISVEFYFYLFILSIGF